MSRLFFDSMIQIYRERIIFPIFLAIFLLDRLWHLPPDPTSSPIKNPTYPAVLLSSPGLLLGIVLFQGYKAETAKFLEPGQMRMELGLRGSAKILRASLILSQSTTSRYQVEQQY